MRELTISEDQMRQMVGEIFQGKPKKQPLRRVLYTIYVRHSIDEGRRQADRGQTIPHEKVMEAMWKQINTGLSGLRKRNRSLKKSSRES
jgi:hypothetical protein